MKKEISVNDLFRMKPGEVFSVYDVQFKIIEVFKKTIRVENETLGVLLLYRSKLQNAYITTGGVE